MDRRQFLSFIAGAVALPSVAHALPSPPPRPHRLNLLNAHTKETFSGIYRDDNGPIPRVMDELSVFLRDFHTGDKIGIDVDLLDFLSHVMQSVGQNQATNTTLNTINNGQTSGSTNSSTVTSAGGVVTSTSSTGTCRHPRPSWATIRA